LYYKNTWIWLEGVWLWRIRWGLLKRNDMTDIGNRISAWIGFWRKPSELYFRMKMEVQLCIRVTPIPKLKLRVSSTNLFIVLFNHSQIISAILPIPSHFWEIAADFPVFTLCEGTEKPADSFVLLREKKTKIVISTTVNVNIKSVILFLNLPPL